MKYISWLIVSITIIFNLWLYFPETKILADPNDNIFQYSLVNRTDWVWKNYGCPFSLTCLPNLVDHNVPNWAEGYPLPFYYSHIPQIITVASYHLFINPIVSLLNPSYTLYEYYNLTKYLLLSFFPVSVYIALRLVGTNTVFSAFAAFLSSQYSTDGLYGIDSPSFLWRGYGLTSQLYAIFFLPLGIAFTFKALRDINNNKKILNSSVWAGIFLTLTTADHLGIGIIGLLSTIPFLFFDLNFSHILSRFKKALLIYSIVLLSLSYWILPILLNNNYHIISFWDPLWKFNSYGWYEALRQFTSGEIFDWKRWPVITAIVLIGLFIALLNSSYFPLALVFILWFLFYFGRTTWGGLIDLIPGMKDFHQHRFLVGIHISSLFLIPLGIEYIINLFIQIAKKVFYEPDFKTIYLHYQKVINTVIFIITILSISWLVVGQTIDYAKLNSRWIGEANNAYLYDENNFKNLTSYLHTKPPARIYAGRPGNWGNSFRLGSTQMYMLFGVTGFDISQFLPETWSPLSENEQDFDERIAEDYDLLNIRYVIAPSNQGFSEKITMDKKFGPFELYQAPSTGWFDVVTSPMFVSSDKSNYLNLVHYWWKSYARRWKMHPLISVEKNPVIPNGMQKTIKMVDEVSYQESTQDTSQINTSKVAGGLKNIFADYPFVFPESTVSGKIISEKVDRQKYSGVVTVPPNCPNCYIMFKMSYHPNWKVYLDGKEAEKLAVFPFYLATPAFPGTHTVEFIYQPNKLKVLLLIAEIVLGFGVIGYILVKKKFAR